MEALKYIMLSTCMFVLLNIVVPEVNAVPRNDYYGGRDSHRGSCARGFSRCATTSRLSRGMCIPDNQVCDGTAQCPMGDDERMCSKLRPTVTSTLVLPSTIVETATTTLTPDISAEPARVTQNIGCTVDSLILVTHGDSIVSYGTICWPLETATSQLEDMFSMVPVTALLPTVISAEVSCEPTQLYP